MGTIFNCNQKCLLVKSPLGRYCIIIEVKLLGWNISLERFYQYIIVVAIVIKIFIIVVIPVILSCEIGETVKSFT